MDKRVVRAQPDCFFDIGDTVLWLSQPDQHYTQLLIGGRVVPERDRFLELYSCVGQSPLKSIQDSGYIVSVRMVGITIESLAKQSFGTQLIFFNRAAPTFGDFEDQDPCQTNSCLNRIRVELQ